MKIVFHKNLNIATVRSNSSWNKFVVHTLLQNTSSKQPSINAYLAARYSRSSDSILDIASEVMGKGVDAAERLEKIFAGYGHKSVGDMADLFVCIENIPMYMAMKLFYMNSVVSGQERSTRYQDFSNPQFVRIPEEVCSSVEVRKEYDRLILKQMNDYRELKNPTSEALAKFFKVNEESPQEVSALKSRSFDTLRYLLPYGLDTSAAYLMSARNWSENISYLCSGSSIVGEEVSSLLLNLLGDSDLEARGYIREADGLIRHTEANCSRATSTQEVLEYMGKRLDRKQEFDIGLNDMETVKVSYSPEFSECLVSHYEALLNPLGSASEYEFSEEDQEEIGEILFENHNHHNQLGNIGQSGAVKIEGFSSLGVLKDLNRHRSFERFIPLFHDEIDMDQELDRRSDECFYLCNYLDLASLKSLRQEYVNRLVETYDAIKEWRQSAKKSMSLDVCNEFTKYLLPHAHATRYIFYASFDDLQYTINLRVRNGGHIAYRTLVYEWLRKLYEKDAIWGGLLKRIITPSVSDKGQFVDRS